MTELVGFAIVGFASGFVYREGGMTSMAGFVIGLVCGFVLAYIFIVVKR